jgi:hypothetical protein
MFWFWMFFTTIDLYSEKCFGYWWMIVLRDLCGNDFSWLRWSALQNRYEFSYWCYWRGVCSIFRWSGTSFVFGKRSEFMGDWVALGWVLKS